MGVWGWASNDHDADPDVVMACAGDVPTQETLAAVSILREELPELRVRVVNVVDLLRLSPADRHPHGTSDRNFDAIFTANKPVIFAYHSYPWTIHRLTYRRANHENIHVHGYNEEGTITTALRHDGAERAGPLPPGDGRRRSHLPQLGSRGTYLKQKLQRKLYEHKR